MAPISLVQAVLAGGAVTLAVMSQRLFGDPVERRQWLALLLGGAGLALLAVTVPQLQRQPLRVRARADPLLRGWAGAARRRHSRWPPVRAARRPPRHPPRRPRRHPLRPRRDRDQGPDRSRRSSAAVVAPWIALIVVCGGLAQYTAVAALQRGGAIETIGLMGLVANAIQIAGGVLVFGDPLSADPLGIALQATAFAMVCLSALLLPDPRRAAVAPRVAARGQDCLSPPGGAAEFATAGRGVGHEQSRPTPSPPPRPCDRGPHRPRRGRPREPGKGPSSRDPAVTLTGLFPRFDPAQTDYVSRCGRGAEPIRAEVGGGATVKVGSGPARAGSVPIDPAVRPGEDFLIAVAGDGARTGYRVRCLPADFPTWRFEPLRSVAPGFFTVSFRASQEAAAVGDRLRSRGRSALVVQPRDPGPLGAGPERRHGSPGHGRSATATGCDPRMAHEIRSPAGKLLRTGQDEGTRSSTGTSCASSRTATSWSTPTSPERANLRRFGGPGRGRRSVSAEIEELDPRRAGAVALELAPAHRPRRRPGAGGATCSSNAKRGPAGRCPTFDPVHINSIEPRGKDEVVISTRHTDAVYGIQRSSGDDPLEAGRQQDGGLAADRRRPGPRSCSAGSTTPASPRTAASASTTTARTGRGGRGSSSTASIPGQAGRLTSASSTIPR